MSSVSSLQVPEWLLWLWAAHLDPHAQCMAKQSVHTLKDDSYQTLIFDISGGCWPRRLSLDIISGA